jgi:hypothetical protein
MKEVQIDFIRHPWVDEMNNSDLPMCRASAFFAVICKEE